MLHLGNLGRNRLIKKALEILCGNINICKGTHSPNLYRCLTLLALALELFRKIRSKA